MCPLGARRQPGRQLSPAAVLWALQFVGGLASGPAYGLLAVYVETALHQPPSVTASLRSIQMALGGLIAPMAGSLADRLGYRAAYIWGMTSTVTACAVFLTGQPLALVLLFLYSGLVGSLQTASGQAYLMEASGRARLGRASAGYFLGYTLGTALGSDAGGWTAKHLGFASLGATTTLTAALLIAGALLFLPHVAASSHPDRKQAAGGQAVALSPASLSALLARREVRLLLGIRFLPTCYWGAVTLLVPLLLFRLTRDPAVAGSYGGVSLAMASVCQIVTGRACDRAGLRRPVLIAPIGITVSAIGLALGARSVGALWVFGVLGACSAWSLSTTMPSLINDVSRPGEKGRMVGLTAFAWSAGMLAGNQIAGVLAGGRLGAAYPGLPFALAALCAAGTMGLAAAMVGGGRGIACRQEVRDTSAS